VREVRSKVGLVGRGVGLDVTWCGVVALDWTGVRELGSQ